MDEARFSNVNNDDDRVKSVINLTKSILVDISDYELSIVSNGMRLIMMDPPSTKLLVTSRITDLVKSKSSLQYIILKVKDIRRSINIPYMNSYNQQFTILTRQGRPSKSAIDSEIHFLNENMRSMRDKLSDIDNLLEFLTSYLDYIDKIIYTLESRKFDL